MCSDLAYGAVRRIILDVAEGVEFMHERGVAHHDIKGANVLLSEEDDGAGGTCLRALVGDLGMAGPLRQTRSEAERCAQLAGCQIRNTAKLGTACCATCPAAACLPTQAALVHHLHISASCL
jgi:serine/threonine protein kinase